MYILFHHILYNIINKKQYVMYIIINHMMMFNNNITFYYDMFVFDITKAEILN